MATTSLKTVATTSVARIFFFDTETTGLIPKYIRDKETKRYVINRENCEDVPRMVSICYKIGVVQDNQVHIEEVVSEIIKPDGYEIPQVAIDIHGISQETAETEGTEIVPVLENMAQAIEQADYISGHNVEFDLAIVQAECLRNKVKLKYNSILLDTMKVNPDFHYGKYWYLRNGYMNLGKLYKHLYKKEPVNAHQAEGDVDMTIAIFRKIYNCRKL